MADMPRHKKLAQGLPLHNKYAAGGTVKPKVPGYADDVVADSRRPVTNTRAGNRTPEGDAGKQPKRGNVAPLTKQSKKK